MRSEGDSGNSIVVVFVRVGGTRWRDSIPSRGIGDRIVHRKGPKFPSIPASIIHQVTNLDPGELSLCQPLFLPAEHAPTREHHVNYTVSHLGDSIYSIPEEREASYKIVAGSQY